MTACPIRVERLERVTADGQTEKLEFEPGLNTLVGRPNTGKTVWLTMLDYALGDRAAVETSLSAELASRYSVIRVVLWVGGDAQVVIERRWKEPGSKHKVYVDGRALSVDDFSAYFLPKLGIPVLHYPQGDPYSSRTWPVLSWRSLFRHIFRRQDIGWGGLVERQPEGDQHACILQFIGVAESLYSDDYGQLVNLRKERMELEARRQNYQATLNEIARDLLDVDGVVSVTPSSISEGLDEIEKTIGGLREGKNEAFGSALEQQGTESASLLRERAEERAELAGQHSNLVRELRESERRLTSIGDYLNKVDDEKTRLERASVAGQVFSDIRITNCPACDQPIRGSNSGAERCFLCHRELPLIGDDLDTARERVSVGILQLREETRESEQLQSDLQRRVEELRHLVRVTGERLAEVEADIERLRQPASTVFSERVSQMDVEIGRLEERRKQWRRIEDALKRREVISKQITELQQKIGTLDGRVEAKSAGVDLTAASDALVDGMNDYLGLLNRFRADAWTQSEIALSLRERQFRFTVGGEPWASRLGGTLTLYFLLAYQFGLLKLSNTEPFNYPGLAVLDMPAELPDIEVSDLENFAIEPFARLLEADHMADCQVIVAGSSFKDLSGANKIELTRVFT